MNKKQIVERLKDAITNFSQGEFSSEIEILLNGVSNIEFCEIISQLFLDQYARLRADYLAIFLEIVLKKKHDIALVNHPTNKLFALTVVTGSKDLYDCYIEEALEPLIEKKAPKERQVFFKQLLTVAADLNESIITQYEECVKGKDYNGVFGTDETYENALLINSEDYDAMERMIARYNAILGRRNILKDLLKRAGMELMHG